MKKIIMAVSLLALGACNSMMQNDTTVPTSTTGRLKMCSMQEATRKVQDGSAFTQTLSASAEEISTICIRKLALQSAGLDDAATQDATIALQNLMGAAAAMRQ